MKTNSSVRARQSSIEPLEARIAPATLDFNPMTHVLTYTATAGEANDVTLEYQDATGGHDVITDDGETTPGSGFSIPITLTQAAIDAGFVLSVGNTKATGPHSASTSIVFDLGDANDLMHLDSSTTNVTIDGGGGTNTIGLGAGALADNMNPVILKATGGSNVLTIDDSTSTANGTQFTIGIGLVKASNALGGSGAGLTFADTTSLLLKTSPQADTINVEFTRTTLVTVQSGAGDDTINVAGGAKTLNELSSKVTLDLGTGANVLNLHDENSTAANVTLTSKLVDRGAGTIVDVASLSGELHYFASTTAASPLLVVPSVDAGTKIVFHFSGVTHPFIQAAGVSNNLDDIAGEIDVASTAATSTIFLHDSGSSGGHQYIFNGGVLARNGHQVLSGAGLSGITLTSGSGNNLIDGAASSVALNLSGNSGDDLILPSRHGDVIFHGGGIDTLRIAGLAGDAVVHDASIVATGFTTTISDSSLGVPVPFPVVEIGGDAGVNHFSAPDYTGFAALDGAGGKDVITESKVKFTGNAISYTDEQGDLAMLKTTKSKFSVANFLFLPDGAKATLAELDLTAAAFTGAGITLSVKQPPKTTDHVADVGLINAAGVNLGAVKIGGDLGAIIAGASSAKVKALTSLTVQSLGTHGIATQLSGGTTASVVSGTLGALAMKGAFGAATVTVLGTVAHPEIGSVGKLTVGADFGGGLLANGKIGSISLGSASGASRIETTQLASIGAVTIAHSASGFTLTSAGSIGAVKVGGDLTGTRITAVGNFQPKNAAGAVAIKSLTVAGDLSASSILAGYAGLVGVNADASIGAVSVTKNWSASNLVAGAKTTATFGDGTDAVITSTSGPFSGTAGGNPAIAASIASVIIKGTATGSANVGETFGIDAQAVGSVKVGGAPATHPHAPANLLLGSSGNFKLVLLS